MTNLLLNLFASTPAAAATPKGARSLAHSAHKPAGLDLFRLVLAGQSRAPAARAEASKTSTGAPPTALQTKIEKMIAAGASHAEIVATLAATLANSVAAQLGATGADARSKLQAVFATALAPPGEPAPAGSAADRARALAQRYRGVEAVATATIDQQSSGQQNRIAGTVLDTHWVKDDPAHKSTLPVAATAAAARVRLSHTEPVAAPDHIIAPASLGAQRAPAGPPDPTLTQPGTPQSAATAAAADALPALAAPPVSRPAAGVTTGPGDGRSVQFGSKSAVSTGGDTLLGRILTRASLAADARGDASKTGSTHVADDQASSQGARRPALDAGASHAQLTSFVKAFSAALAATPADDAKPAAHAAVVAPALEAATPAPVAPAPAYTAVAAPLRVDRVDAAAPAAAPDHPAPIDHASITDQVLRGAFMRNVGTSSEMRLSLVPQSLGDVNVKLVVNSGSVTAHVVAQTAEVRDALVAAQPQLSKSLADAGLKLSSFTVDLSGGGFAGFSQQHNGRPTPDGRAQTAVSAVGDDVTADAQLEAIPTFGPSVAATNPSDYNYLA